LLLTFHKLYEGQTESPTLTDWLNLQNKVLRDIKYASCCCLQLLPNNIKMGLRQMRVRVD